MLLGEELQETEEGVLQCLKVIIKESCLNPKRAVNGKNFFFKSNENRPFLREENTFRSTIRMPTSHHALHSEILAIAPGDGSASWDSLTLGEGPKKAFNVTFHPREFFGSLPGWFLCSF